MSIAGLDIGTTGCKVTVFDDAGQLQYTVYREYPVHRTLTGHEVDASAIWDGVCQVLAEAKGQDAELRGLGITSFGETFVALDANDQPLAPCMLYTDPRGGEQCDRLKASLGAERIAAITGLAPHSMYSLPKIMWLKENRPELYAKIERICLIGDYVGYRLTGRHQIDYSLASRTMAFDIKKLCWSLEVLEYAGISPELLGKPVPTGSSCGRILPDLAESLHLPATLEIVTISHDQVAAAVGSGVFTPGQAVDGAGTVECITPVFDRLPEGKELLAMTSGSFAIVPYVIPGTYVSYAFSYTGGALIQWYLETLAKGEKLLAEHQNQSVYEYLEAQMADEPTGLLVLPHFAGAATPYMDTGSKGAVLGLTVEHTNAQLYRAMMEGVCYEMMLNTVCLNRAGVKYTSLRATGGGAASRVWMQMKADLLGVPIVCLGSAEAGTVGSAMLTGIAVGVFSDLQTAAAAMITERETYVPRPAQNAAYQKQFARYARVYEAVRPLMEEI